MSLTNVQKKYLKGLAHSQKPIVLVGQKGITPELLTALKEALESHELIKIKFLENKEKESKKEMTQQIVEETQSELLSTIGHTVIFFKRARKPENRKIQLPS